MGGCRKGENDYQYGGSAAFLQPFIDGLTLFRA